MKPVGSRSERGLLSNGLFTFTRSWSKRGTASKAMGWSPISHVEMDYDRHWLLTLLFDCSFCVGFYMGLMFRKCPTPGIRVFFGRAVPWTGCAPSVCANRRVIQPKQQMWDDTFFQSSILFSMKQLVFQICLVNVFCSILLVFQIRSQETNKAESGQLD